jgi:methionine sulfoxide reductase heme-binding subunit
MPMMAVALPWTDRAGRLSPLKAFVFACLFVPGLWLAVEAMTVGLGPRPLTVAIHDTGDWAVRFLLLSLAVTPLRRIARFTKLILVRRMLGLAALSYALLHFTLYCFDQKWNVPLIASEIVLRLYLTIGFIALLGLIALGATSYDAAIRRLGGAWGRLHKIVYGIGILALIHYFMQTKADVYLATLMAGLFMLLMLYRLAHWRGFDIVSLPVLTVSAVLAGLLTALAEITWYGTTTGVPVVRVLFANLDFSFSIRPAWWVLGLGLAVAALAFVRGRMATEPRPRGRRAAAKALA